MFTTFGKMIKARPGKFQAVIVSAVALLTAFGVAMDAEQVAAITVFTAVVIGFATDQSIPPTPPTP